jgi:hypothetical protein
LLVFIIGPLGSGIPLGVIMARNLGLSPIETVALYLVSDVIMALIVLDDHCRHIGASHRGRNEVDSYPSRPFGRDRPSPSGRVMIVTRVRRFD